MDELIRTIQKNQSEEIRCALDEFKGHELCSLRVWAKKPDGNMIPTPKGISFSRRLIPELIAALQAAQAADQGASNGPPPQQQPRREYQASQRRTASRRSFEGHPDLNDCLGDLLPPLPAAVDANRGYRQ